MPDTHDEISVKPEIWLLEQVLDSIGRGDLRVPKFQRPFVWRPEQMLGLFDSIERGYPIGSLLIWQTDLPLESLDEIGGLPIPPPESNRQTAYVLDGHQRLSTLYGALRRSADARRSPDQKDWMWWVYRDLRSGDDRSSRYRHWKTEARPPLHFLPLRSLLRTMDFLGFARELQQRAEDEDVDNLIADAEAVAARLKSHQMAIVRLTGGSLSQAVEVFSRVNSSGQPMSPDQMVSALTYTTTGPESLSERIEDIRERIAATGFGDIPSLTVFRVVLAISGEEDIQRTGWEVLAKRVEGGLVDAVEKADAALDKTIEFLRDTVWVPVARLIPYNLQVVLLAAFFHYCAEPDRERLADLERWFWTTSWAGTFAGANTTQVREALQRMRDFALGKGPLDFHDQRARPFPSKFDFRSARVRTFILWELREFPHRIDSDRRTTIKPAELLARSHTEAYRHAVTNRRLADVSSPANRLIMSSPSGTSLRQTLVDLALDDEGRSVLKSHGIPEESVRYLRLGKDQGFIETRTQFLAERERQFMSGLGVQHADDQVGEADIDTE
ncbi:hypothetical protein LP52_05090 [Streptomonospora alba]|uniref:GmrSD restriction endonucleases N-terminal domain-containing protein n=1 Tax=Streptomonospora alba TaxID=183763 RepID=A0A0C2G8H3_9ACTN|nr:DUF262 domain-containing protein [Streptomonospora alba]KIH99643.1 hypothetical protein LP52_05090 [Streptomonospora alba]